MGNASVKDFLGSKEDASGILSNFMNAELLGHGQFLSDRWTALAVEKHKDFQNMFDWNNVQSSSNSEHVEEALQLHEKKENLLVGMLPTMTSPDLLNPAFFDDVQTAFSPTEVAVFKDLQNQKFLMLYHLYYLLQTLRKKDQNIIQTLRSQASHDLPKAAEVGIQSGVHIIISLLREAAEKNSKLKDDTLNFLIDLFTEVKPLSLWGTKQIDVVLDRSLHTVAEYLEEVILSENTSDQSKCKAIKVLFSLGLLRGSLPNLLSVVSLIRKLQLDVDLTRELKLLKLEKAQTSIRFDKSKSSTKIFFNSCIANDSPAPEKAPYHSMTTDGRFLYIHSENEGLLKIGTGYGYTMFGKVYKHLKEYRLKERGTLAFVLGKLYYRSSRISPAVLIEIDPDTLVESTNQIMSESLAPNSLWAELTNPEVEFPIPQVDEDKKTETKKPSAPNAKTTTTTATTGANSGPQRKDIRLMRPAQRSPMFTDGRYIYICSQWTVDSRSGRAGEEEDEEEEGDNQETKQARYGVDIFDPLVEFEHVRSVELFDPKPVEAKDGSNKTKANPPLTVKQLDQAYFTTNGSQLLIGCPGGTDEGTEAKFKFFNLSDGKLTESKVTTESHSIFNVCFDQQNNTVWGLNDNKKTFDTFYCFRNNTIPEVHTFPEESEFYSPFENQKLIEVAEEEIQLGESADSNNLAKERLEKKKEDIQLLFSLGFHIKTKGGEKVDLKAEKPENLALSSKATQLFILSNISRLAESYASIEYMSNDTPSTNIRRPYCVHLIDKTFDYLEQFLDNYTKTFFNSDLKDQLPDDEFIDQCSFLATLRILKYNLAALENFSQSLRDLGLEIVNEGFSAKLEKLIWSILEMKPRENKDLEDLRQAVYKEALSILKYTLSIMYPHISEILNVLRKNLKNIDKKLYRDTSIAILFWLKSGDHISRLVNDVVSSTDSQKLADELKQLTNDIFGWEIQHFSNYMKSFTEWQKPGKYQRDELISTGMSFLLEFQKEVLYQLGQKSQEKGLDVSPIHILANNLTEAIAKYGILANLEIQYALERLGPQVAKSVEASIEAEEASPEPKGDKAKKDLKNKKKTKTEQMKEAYQDLWESVSSRFVDNTYFFQALALQVNTLSALTSNFLIAAKTLRQVTSLLSSFNSLYTAKKELDKTTTEKLAKIETEREETVESEHPPALKSEKKDKIHIPGAKQLRIVFDPKCDLRQNCDYLEFFSDEKMKDKVGERLTTTATFPKGDLIVKSDTVWYSFHKDGCRNSQWGYKFTVYAKLEDRQETDWISGLHRTTNWLAGKCAAQLINGSALQQAMLADEEQRYNALLNSKLFSGGIEKCYFTGGKEGVWTQVGEVMHEYQAGHLTDYLSGEMTEDEKAEEDFLNSITTIGKDPQMEKTLEFIQKAFVKEALWGNLGGENGSKIVRATFAVVVKHGGLINDLKEAMIDVEIDEDVKKGKLTQNLKNLLKRWHAASRMRPWLVEKRKDIDDLEEKRKNQQASKSVSTTKATTATTTKTASKKKSAKKKEEPEEKKEPEEIMVEENKDNSDPIVSGQMQVRDTEEIIQKMIEQIVKKAQFLCQLIPAKHWTQDKTEKKEKQLLFRSASRTDTEVNKEEEWKRRLQQWKSVRQAKQVYKSLEDETQEISSSLNSSALLCLQSAVSIRRLKKQVESAYLRAICRTMGLNALTTILHGCQSSLFRQDVVGWLCSSLRGADSKLYHFTDNLQGCGHYLESAVNTAFKNLIVAIVRSMAKSNQSEELKCMLEALKWKYHGDDHMFLAEIDLFGILRGNEQQPLLRGAWGKSLHPVTGGKVDHAMVKKLITLFETVVVLCVGKLNMNTNSEPIPQALAKKDKIPLLERHVSVLDEYSVDILIRQAFHVLFSELEDADKNYKEFKGIDWLVYQRYLRRKEIEAEKDKKNAKKDGTKKPEARERWGEEDEGAEASPADADDKKDKKEEESDIDEEIELEFIEELKEEEKSAQEKQEETKDNTKKEKDPKKLKYKRLKEIIEREERSLFELQNKLYDPDFLYRLLCLIFKCVTMGNDIVSAVVGNPKYIAILLSLMKSSPPQHQIIILKTVDALFSILPVELFYDSAHSLKERLGTNPKDYFLVSEKDNHSLQIIKHLLNHMSETRNRGFEVSLKYPDQYAVSNELVGVLRNLLENVNWNKDMTQWVNDGLSGNDVTTKQVILAVIGGELNGLRFGGKIHISSTDRDEIFEDNVLLKSKLPISTENATILGFTQEYKEKLSEEEKKKREEKKDTSDRGKIYMSIGSVSNVCNPLVLIHSTINKELTNFATIELTTIPRFNSVAVDTVPFNVESYDLSKNLEKLLPVFKWAVSSETTKDSHNLYLRTLSMKALSTYCKSNANAYLITSKYADIVNNLLELSTKRIVSTDSSSLEVTEEKLYRLLQYGCENETSLGELPTMAVTIKNKELEILLGKDLSSMKYTISSGFNIEKATTHYEVLIVDDLASLAQRKDLKEYLSTRAVLIQSSDITSEKYPEIILNAQMVITHGYDMQKFQDFWEANFAKGAKGKKSEKEAKAEEGAGGEEEKKNEELIMMPESSETKKQDIKLPNCLVNISEKSFNSIIKEHKNQLTKEFKNVFEVKKVIDELVEFGFPRDVCEKYLQEHSKESFDVMINDIAKIIEQNEQDKIKVSTGETSESKGPSMAPSKGQGQSKQGENAQGGQQGEMKISKGGNKATEESKGEEEKKEEETKETKETKESIETEAEKELKLKMAKAEKMAKGGQMIDDDVIAKKKKLKEEDEGPNMKKIGQNKETSEPVIGGGKAEPKIGEIISEKPKVEAADDDDEDDEAQQLKQKKTYDIEKEEANPCFKCKGEKELQSSTEEKNKNYDELVDFEGMNRIGKLVLFKQLSYNLYIFYARRTLLNLLENWSEDIPIQLITDATLQSSFLTFLKLVSNEGIFSSSSFCSNELIRKIGKILENIFAKESQNKAIAAFIDKLLEVGIKDPITQLSKKFTDLDNSSRKTSKGKGADDKDIKYYSGRNTTEVEIEEPSLDYSLWLAQTVLGSSSESVKKRIYNLDILYQLFGFIPYIRFNKSLLWGVLIFCLDVLDKFITNISLLELQSKNILNHPNVVILHDFFDALKGREKIESLSRRTQIACEILINLNRLQKVIENKYNVENIHKDTLIDLTKYKNIENLADVVEVMENYQENKSLIASSWLQVSPDLIKKEEKIIDGDHFYFKNLHTYKVNLAHASECTIKFSEDCQTDSGDSLLFSSDPKGELSVQKSTGNLSKKTLNYPSGTFYVHFPTHGADVVAFGANDQYQFSSDTSNTGPVVLEEFSSWNTVRIDGGDTHTVILNNLGELWSTGTGSQTGSAGTAKVPAKINSKDKVRLFSCGSNFTIFVTEANEIYAVGNNGDGRSGLNWNSGTSNPQIVELSGSKVVKQLSCGFNHSMMVTADGLVYGTGSNEHGQLGINDESGNKVTGIQSFRQVNDLNKKKIIKVIAGQNVSYILMREKGKNILLSAGEKAGGKLGLGDEVGTSVTTFSQITALEEENIIDIHSKRKHAVAVTSSGKLYAWGINEHGQLGHDNKENLYTPKAVAFFEGSKVLSATVGANHTVVIAKTKGEERNRLYVMGDNTNSRLGIKGGKEKLFLPTQVDFFEEKSPMKIYSGTNHTLVITEPVKISKIRDSHKAKCELTGETEINGPMYVDILNSNKIYSATAAEDPKHVSKLPPVLVLVSEAITSTKDIQWPVLETAQLDELLEAPTENTDFGVKCKVSGQPITGVCFVNMHQHDYEPQEYLSAEAVKEISEEQVSQTLYYRITRKLKAGKFLPVVPRTNFSAQSDTYGYNITVTPKFGEKGNDYMTEKYKESFDAFFGDMKQIKPDVDEQFVDLINNLTQKLEKNVFELSENVTFPKEEIAIRNAIEKSSQEFLKKRFLILKNLNTKFKSLLPYIDFSAKKETTRLRNIYANASVYIFWDVKSELFNKLLENDAKASNNPKVKVNRLRANKFIAKGKPDHTGEFTVFGQIFQHLKSEGYNCFKVAKDVNPFSVQFVGEASVDVGGPYREAISQLCTELQSGALPLFTQSPNQKNDSGQFREKWVFNPSATSLVHMQMFEFLGVLMGCSIRTRNFLNLDLPSIIWKQLVDVPITRKDLENIDRYLIQCLDDIIHIHKKGVDENTFSDIIQEKFVTTLSDGSEVELIPGGKSKIVTFDTRVEWTELVEKARLNEFKKQAEAVRKGLTLVVPEGVLNLLTWREIETLVCGKPILDLDLLKQNTVYRGCSESDSLVDFFWKALQEFSPEERSMYLRFVWGRSRLPLTSKDFPMKHTVETLRAGTNIPDIMLPVAHTCFFQIELPKYSSYEILRDKLRYAITNCQAIDTDGRAYDIWDDED